jgi:hypothetical protein
MNLETGAIVVSLRAEEGSDDALNSCGRLIAVLESAEGSLRFLFHNAVLLTETGDRLRDVERKLDAGMDMRTVAVGPGQQTRIFLAWKDEQLRLVDADAGADATESTGDACDMAGGEALPPLTYVTADGRVKLFLGVSHSSDPRIQVWDLGEAPTTSQTFIRAANKTG